MHYILSKEPLRLCRSVEECEIRNQLVSEEENETENEMAGIIAPNEMSEEEGEEVPVTKKIPILKIMFVILLILILSYIFYSNWSYILSSASFLVQVIILICVTLITFFVFSKVL
jgi:hypothetical protein